MAKLREKMETSRFLRRVAQARRHFSPTLDAPNATIDCDRQPPGPQEDLEPVGGPGVSPSPGSPPRPTPVGKVREREGKRP